MLIVSGCRRRKVKWRIKLSLSNYDINNISIKTKRKVVLCDLDMPSSPLYILWSKNGIAPKNSCRKINTNLKATTYYFAVASVLIVLFTFNLAPNGVNAAAVVRSSSNEVDEAGAFDLGQGHERSKRAVVTPLGKRLTTNLVAELGKRPRHLYSFGIGKFHCF